MLLGVLALSVQTFASFSAGKFDISIAALYTDCGKMPVYD